MGIAGVDIRFLILLMFSLSYILTSWFYFSCILFAAGTSLVFFFIILIIQLIKSNAWVEATVNRLR